MQQALWKVLLFIISIILLIVYPMMQMWEMQEHMLQIELINLVAEFLDEVRYTKEITSDRYERLLSDINLIDTSISVKFSHRISYWIPEVDGLGVETGKAKQEYLSIGHEEIVEQIQNQGFTNSQDSFLSLSEGDWFEVLAKNSEKTKTQVIKEFIWRTPINYSRYYVRLSGMIH